MAVRDRKLFGELWRLGARAIGIAHGMNQEQVDEYIGTRCAVSRPTIQRYKTGRCPTTEEHGRILTMLEEVRATGYLSTAWERAFLREAGHPDWVMIPEHSDLGVRWWNNLPRPLYRRFVMRHRTYALVRRAVQERGPLVQLVGLGGVGKTSLLREIAERARSDFDAAVWLSDAEKPGTSNLSVAWDEIARTLDHPTVAQLAFDEKQRAIDRLLRTKRILLVLDSADTVTDSSLLLWLLRVPKPSMAMVSSRAKNLHAWSQRTRNDPQPLLIELPGMTDDEAAAFVELQYQTTPLQRQLSPDQVTYLVRTTGGNPKAMAMVVGLLSHDSDLFVRHVHPAGSDDVSPEMVEAAIDRLCSGADLFTDLFAHAWLTLDAPAQAVLATVPLFISGATCAALAAVTELSESLVAESLRTLRNLSLVDAELNDDRGPPSYSVHPLVRRLAERALPEAASPQDAIWERWAAYYADLVAHETDQWREKPQTLYWNTLFDGHPSVIDAEWKNIEAVLDWAHQNAHHRVLCEIVFRLAHYMDRRFKFAERLRYATYAAEAAHKLNDYTREALLRIDTLAWIYLITNQLVRAEHAVREGLEALAQADTDAGDAGPLAWAFRARIALQQRRFEEATQHIARALALDACAPVRFRTLVIAGEIAACLHNYDLAITRYQEALVCARAYEHGDATQPRYRLGFALLDAGRTHDAREQFTKVLENPRRVSVDTVYALYGLARMRHSEGDYTGAEQLAEQARALIPPLDLNFQLQREIEGFLEMLTADEREGT
jgi:tetratricopeptide (TPR) repeat protein